MRVAILGGTGGFGRALAVRLLASGEDEIVIGSRDEARAHAAAADLGPGAAGARNAEAVRGVDLAVLAVRADAAVETATAIAGPLGTTPLLTVAAELVFATGGVRPDPAAISLAERIQAVVGAPVVAGLHSVAAGHLTEAPPEEDALVCGDDPAAKELALAFAGKVVAGRALDAGPLAGARTLEGLTAVLVNLNRRYRARTGVAVTGIAEA